MSRSRIVDDDEPGRGESPSPRTTIVGGRPPERQEALPPVPHGIQRLLRLASVDAAFRRELCTRRAEVAEAAGIALTPTERAILAAIPSAQLEEMAEKLPPPPAPRRDFLRQTAATAVVLLGGAALGEGLGGCRNPSDAGGSAGPQPPVGGPMESEGGAAPDLPPERPEDRPVGPTRGITADVPPERPEDRPMTTKGGAAPDLP